MPTDRHLAFTPNLVVGITIMLLGSVLLLDRLEVVDAGALLRWWPLLLILFGASLIVQAWRGDGDGDRHERPIVSPGFILFVAIVFLLATQAQRRSELTASDPYAQTVSLFVVMGADDHTSRATTFRGGDVTTVMGRSRLDLREAGIAPGDEVVIDVVNVMGRTDLLMPRDWAVEIDAPRVMGRVRDERSGRPAPEAAPSEPAPDALELPAGKSRPPRVILRGVVLLGRISIRS